MNAGKRLQLAATGRRLGYDLADGEGIRGLTQTRLTWQPQLSIFYPPNLGDFLANIRKLISQSRSGRSIIEILLIARHHVRAFQELCFVESGSRLAA